MTANPRRTWLLGAATAAAAAGAAFGWWRFSPRTGHAQAAATEAAPTGVWARRFERPAGGELVMAEMRGQPLLLNFWATWCAPCIAEMPMLDAFQRDQAAKGWQVVGLAVDNADPVREFVAKRPLGFAIGLVGFAGADLARELGNSAGALPFSVVFDRQGNIAHKKLGALKPEDLASWAKSVT